MALLSDKIWLFTECRCTKKWDWFSNSKNLRMMLLSSLAQCIHCTSTAKFLPALLQIGNDHWGLTTGDWNIRILLHDLLLDRRIICETTFWRSSVDCNIARDIIHAPAAAPHNIYSNMTFHAICAGHSLHQYLRPI